MLDVRIRKHKGEIVKIDTYQSNKDKTKFLSVTSGTDVEEIKLPEDIDSDLLTLSKFKNSIDISAEKPRIAMDAVDIKKQIMSNGYAIHGASIISEIS